MKSTTLQLTQQLHRLNKDLSWKEAKHNGKIYKKYPTQDYI
jgi:hypothetical protein